MDRRQQNHATMHADVLAVLDSHADAWTKRPRVAAHVAALRAAHAQAAETDAHRATLRTEGLTEAKQALRDSMEAQALALAAAVRPYGRDTKNPALVDAADLTPTDFNTASEADVVTLAERVLRAAEPHETALEEYSTEAGAVAALRVAIEAFRPAGGARDAVRSEREGQTRALPPILDAAGDAVEQLDDLVPGLGDAELTAAYQRARRIDDR